MKRTALPLLAAALFLCAPRGPAAQEIPDHPSKLKYKPLKFVVPDPASLRVNLSTGTIVYLQEDPALPIVELTIYVRGGSFSELEGKEGLADLTASLMRTGGTSKMSPEKLDEELDFLAAQLGVSMGDVYGSASLSILSKDLERGLELLGDVLRTPAFDPERLKLLKAQSMEGLRGRNDSTRSIEAREANRLYYGDFPVNRLATGDSIESITREDLAAFHKEWFYPANFIIAAAGAFKKDAFLGKLEALFKGWPNRKASSPPVPKVTHAPKPGIYCFHKEGKNITQGRVRMGHLGVDIRHEDVQAIRLMSYILGAGGFSSRLMQKVRTEEGLAYDVRSSLQPGLVYPSIFSIDFQSKSESCAYAAKLCLEEIARLQKDGPTANELRDAIQFYQDGFPGFFFSTRLQTASTFARAELLNYPKDYYHAYRERIAALNAGDIKRVAREYLKPERFAWVVVGNIDAIKKGDGEVKLSDLGTITDVPLPDPVTLKRPK